MPAESKAQSRFLNAKFGHAWVQAHHFDNSTKGLPMHVGAVPAFDGKHHSRRQNRDEGGRFSK